MNGDGYGDLVVGAFGLRQRGGLRAGRTCQLFTSGRRRGSRRPQRGRLESDQDYAYFEFRVVGGGRQYWRQVRGRRIGGGLWLRQRGTEAGRTCTSGSAAGLEANAEWAARSIGPGIRLLRDFRGVGGDVNGDGYGDVVVKGPRTTASRGGLRRQGVRLTLTGSAADEAIAALDGGNGPGALSSVPWRRRRGREQRRLRGLGGGGAHLRQQESNEGRAYLYLGSAAGLRRPSRHGQRNRTESGAFRNSCRRRGHKF